jgi:hypothetical protein
VSDTSGDVDARGIVDEAASYVEAQTRMPIDTAARDALVEALLQNDKFALSDDDPHKRRGAVDAAQAIFLQAAAFTQARGDELGTAGVGDNGLSLAINGEAVLRFFKSWPWPFGAA